MPHHLIGETYEWSNEIPTVPTYNIVKPSYKETTY